NQQVEIGLLRPGAVLPVVVRALHFLERVEEVHVAVVQRIVTAESGEFRQAIERDVELPRGAADLEVAGAPDEVRMQIVLVEELEERAPRIEIRDDEVGAVLVAVRSGYARDTSAAHDDALHRRVRDDLASVRLER